MRSLATQRSFQLIARVTQFLGLQVHFNLVHLQFMQQRQRIACRGL